MKHREGAGARVGGDIAQQRIGESGTPADGLYRRQIGPRRPSQNPGSWPRRGLVSEAHDERQPRAPLVELRRDRDVGVRGAC